MVVDCLAEDGMATTKKIASTQKTLFSLCRSSKALLPAAKRRLYIFNADRDKNRKKQHDVRKIARYWACLDWAIHWDRKETVESVMNFTPEVCEPRHLSEAIVKEHFEIAWILLKQEIFHTKLKTRTQDSPIFAAVEAGHTKLVDRIIEVQGLDVSMLDRNDQTVLHCACKYGHLNLVEKFLEEKADPYGAAEPDMDSQITPLVSAIECAFPTERYAIIEAILASRPNFPQSSHQQYKLYAMYIASNGNLDDLELFMGKKFFKPFLNDPPPDIQRKGWLYWLKRAKMDENAEIFRRLLELCPREHCDDSIFREVFEIITIPRVSGAIGLVVVKMLINHFQCWPSSINDFWPKTRYSLESAMTTAIREDDFNLIECLLHFNDLVEKRQDPRDNPMRGSKDGHILSNVGAPCSSEMLNLLLRHGYDVNHTNEPKYDRWYGRTPLQRAIEAFKRDGKGIEVIKDLIPMVDYINKVDNYNRTALHLCVTMSSSQADSALDKVLEIAKILIDNGADLRARANYGNTPLHLAAEIHLFEPFVHLFLDRGANKNLKNYLGQTPLCVLRSSGYSPKRATLDRLL
ncbi:unnamed protein product [Clonostachys rosea f. rosea IK726]|uniref:Uncharacterized protein n=2 Tax=Bionectria ochroleuca TaxID=29856 RepID=A0A0B7JVN8_BIOOC|nr:unnamed protein product [Clonostachys rosea f. rosea IK726]